jgi:glycosyltransferase involved in cell wall biosynthesis
MLPDQRPWRELHWLSLMPDTEVTAIGDRRPLEHVSFARRRYRRPIRRFVEAGALAWLRDLDTIDGRFDWLTSLELCSLVTGQGADMARERSIPHAVLVWGNDPRNPLYRLPPYRWALRRALRADLFLCFIQAARDHCVALGIPEERCHVVYPGIDTELFRPAEEPVDEPVLLFSSPLAANKGVDRVVEAFDLVRRRIPEARLRVVGSGPLERMVRERASESGGAITVEGPMERSGVADALRAAAVFVTAPRPTRVWNEQFGLAYIEAQASGLPVVTTICGTNHEAVREPNVRVPDDAGALADALVTFLADPALRARVGTHNRRYAVEHHEIRRQSEAMGRVFRSAEGA